MCGVIQMPWVHKKRGIVRKLTDNVTEKFHCKGCLEWKRYSEHVFRAF